MIDAKDIIIFIILVLIKIQMLDIQILFKGA